MLVAAIDQPPVSAPCSQSYTGGVYTGNYILFIELYLTLSTCMIKHSTWYLKRALLLNHILVEATQENMYI